MGLGEDCALAVSPLDYGVWRLSGLSELVGCPVAIGGFGSAKICAWAGWGVKRSGRRAARIAAEQRVPCWRLEDGFLRSVGLGFREPPLSIVVDDIGIYYDAGRASLLETLVSRKLAASESVRAVSVMKAWRAARVSKYNHLREYPRPLPDRYVLVADQTYGDASIRFGLAGPASFERMLRAALEENPDCIVLLKVHPDVFAGKKRGHFNLDEVSRIPRVRVLSEDVHPVRLIEHAEAVYVVTSQVGFEGLLWGRPVRTFGMPFFAGWGLTRDELPAPSRRGQATLEQLVHAALVQYPRYINPETGKRCEVEEVLAHLALQRRMRERFPSPVYALGFSRWKKPIVRDFLSGSSVRFVPHAEAIPMGGTLVSWGRKPVNGRVPDVENIRLEDGFIRSVGLGADLIRPLSWVMDRRGIYYDATQSSDLECLLQESAFDEGLIQRARELRRRIVDTGLTKYNVGSEGWRRPDVRGNAAGRAASRVILVPGQVESDASIRYGASFIRTNMGLLQAVRRANPDAYVVYKPHPDVQTGLRSEGEDEGAATKWCDELVHDVPMQVLLDAVDEVHVLTSLSGFEALLRGKSVTTYGQPFYAGWGLTQDMGLMPEVARRRTRRLSLDELVGGTLILYPTYVSRVTGRFTTPERALDELLVWRQHGESGLPVWRKALRVLLRLVKPNG